MSLQPDNALGRRPIWQNVARSAAISALGLDRSFRHSILRVGPIKEITPFARTCASTSIRFTVPCTTHCAYVHCIRCLVLDRRIVLFRLGHDHFMPIQEIESSTCRCSGQSSRFRVHGIGSSSCYLYYTTIDYSILIAYCC